MRSFRVTSDNIPDYWIPLLESPANALHNISVRTIGITNADSMRTLVRLRLNATQLDSIVSGLILSLSVGNDENVICSPHLIVKPGDSLDVVCDEAAATPDVYAVASRSEFYKLWDTHLFPNVRNGTPVLCHEIPLNAGYGITIHCIGASRVAGVDDQSVEVFVEQTNGKVITLLSGKVHKRETLRTDADMIMGRGDKLFIHTSVTDPADIIDCVLTCQRTDEMQVGY